MLLLEKLTFGKTSACRYSVSRPFKENINVEHASAIAHKLSQMRNGTAQKRMV